MHPSHLTIQLPTDQSQATLIGRIFRPDVNGPAIIKLDAGNVIDITHSNAPTVRDICEMPDPATYVQSATGPVITDIDTLLQNSDETHRDPSQPHLLAPLDLQVIKASGVTFIVSLLERVIEEQAKGNPQKATEIRRDINQLIGDDLSQLKPGSHEALQIKQKLIEKGVWSQYLEVGIGPDPEIFTKCPVLSAVGAGSHIGIHAESSWNNPEPEVALVISSQAKAVGAMLANDVNLRDVEGRSALLLGKAKDNNASCALGPFLRLFDKNYTLNDVHACDIELKVEGVDTFILDGINSISKISRLPTDLIHAAINESHQYPDGLALLLGTMFAPIKDRDSAGKGFTHKIDDIVTISTPQLGSLSNRVKHSHICAPWTYGLADLMRNLAARNFL